MKKYLLILITGLFLLCTVGISQATLVTIGTATYNNSTSLSMMMTQATVAVDQCGLTIQRQCLIGIVKGIGSPI